MEILRCPTCLNLLFDPNVKRCPACHAKLRRRSKPTVLAEADALPWNDGPSYEGRSNEGIADDLADRPLPLVQQELQARIEAKTASGFLQRRRAAKAARRIAALPSTVLAGDIVLSQPESEPPASQSKAPDDPPEVIDLPAEAVHDVTSVAEADYVPADPDPEPVVENVPVVEVPVVEEVEEIVEPESEPTAPTRKPRRRAPKAARIEGVLVGVEEVVEPPAPKRTPRTEVAEAPVPVEVPEPDVAEAPVEVAEPEVAAPEVPEPEVVVPEVIEADPTPEPEVIAKPDIVESVPAVNWQRSTSAWTQRVFNTAPRVREAETVTWPPRWKPADKLIDLTEDSDVDQMDASR